ncbi:MAG TPA: hypothetical protein VMP13_04245 [Acidimicrobiia bacterium]|nr:hypothetical protein [Acidimicrobiia bacterium]
MRSAVGHVGAPVRPTARVRPTVPVRLIPSDDGLEPSDPYVRRFWVAALGPGAVAELLRLVSAGRKGEEVRLPRHLPQLLRTGLVTVVDGSLAVRERIPPVPTEMRWRFPPDVAAQHAKWLSKMR